MLLSLAALRSLLSRFFLKRRHKRSALDTLRLTPPPRYRLLPSSRSSRACAPPPPPPPKVCCKEGGLVPPKVRRLCKTGVGKKIIIWKVRQGFEGTPRHSLQEEAPPFVDVVTASPPRLSMSLRTFPRRSFHSPGLSSRSRQRCRRPRLPRRRRRRRVRELCCHRRRRRRRRRCRCPPLPTPFLVKTMPTAPSCR